MIVLQIIVGVCVVALLLLSVEIVAAILRRRHLEEMADKESRERPRVPERDFLISEGEPKGGEARH